MNFSISEIAVILLVALLVIKPGQLPDVVLTLGRFARLLKQLIGKVKEEVNQLIASADKFHDSK